ncbi:hypothetical protein R4Z10_08490 [Niallia sp. XMNu-256]|uniref:hypothetical protein n=1 Tax=Niallia sp. XMNu-256 TaxID=3082444 RepID=UPI0030CB8949
MDLTTLIIIQSIRGYKISEFLDYGARERGTWFLIYPQNKKIEGFAQPEVVYLNVPPGSIKAGPEDDRMYVVDAKNKKPYSFKGEGPGYVGSRFPPVQPNAQGHFDHIKPDERAFSSMTMFAMVRRTLDIWEDYFGHRIKWPFSFPKLELIPRVEWDNAHSGPGFIEFGFPCVERERKSFNCKTLDYSNPYCENFDVLAHEIGHIIKNAVIKQPDSEAKETEEYQGHHEAFGDIVAIVASLHFNSIVDHLLKNTKGNLFSVHELSRVGELDKTRTIRIAFNDKKLSDIKPIFDERRGKWVREEHQLSEPFTGGAFDVLVEVFQHNLIEKGLISEEL